MGEGLKENIGRRSIWLRLFYMIVLVFAYGVAEFITFAVVVFQFLNSLFTGRRNDRLTRLGRNLARYFQQITVFMTFATEEKPFPFAPWPDEPHEDVPVDEDRGNLNADTANVAETVENGAEGDTRNVDDTETNNTVGDVEKPT